jgi:hypothetical protein
MNPGNQLVYAEGPTILGASQQQIKSKLRLLINSSK